MRLGDFTIKSRIYAGFGALFLIAAVLAALGVLQLGTIRQQITGLVSVSGNSARNLNVQYIAESMRRYALK